MFFVINISVILLQFVMCEFLNLLIVISNIYLTDFFLEGRFMK